MTLENWLRCGTDLTQAAHGRFAHSGGSSLGGFLNALVEKEMTQTTTDNWHMFTLFLKMQQHAQAVLQHFSIPIFCS